MTECVDCSTLDIARRAICEGTVKLTSSKRAAYIRRWIENGLLKIVECTEETITVDESEPIKTKKAVKKSQAKRLELPCPHRGEQVGTINCSACQGGPQPVFACALHKRCVKMPNTETRRHKVRDCFNCEDLPENFVPEPLWRKAEYQSLRDRLLEETEILVKSFERHNLLLDFVRSVRQFYPTLPIRIVDDSRRLTRNAETVQATPYVSWHQMAYDSGLPAGRNLAVRESSAKYVIICDDDFVFTRQTDLFALLIPLVETNLDLCGGLVRWRGQQAVNWCGDIHIEDKAGRRSLIMQKSRAPGETVLGIRVQRVDLTFNFFAAKREFLVKHPWDERYKISDEHLDSFLTWKFAGLRAAYTPNCIADHAPTHDEAYKKKRHRNNRNSFNQKWNIVQRTSLPLTRFPG